MKKCAILFTAVLFLAACATTEQYVPPASFENLSTGNALIMVERRNDFIGFDQSVKISDNGRVVGSLSPGKYLIWQRPAGDFVLQIVPALYGAPNSTPLNIRAKAGKQYNFLVYREGGTFKLEQQH
ncbi:MAG: hypothetical protein ACLP9S_06490 [Syntrophales bacterium]